MIFIILTRLQFVKYLSYCMFHENQVRRYFVRMFTSLDLRLTFSRYHVFGAGDLPQKQLVILNQ